MLGVIILLKDDLARIQAIVSNRLPELILQNSLIAFFRQRTVYPTHEACSLGCHAAPNHQRTSTMFYRLLDMVRLAALSVTDPAPGTSIRAETVDFSFI